MKKLLSLAVMILFTVGMAFGQAVSVNGGSIQGTITDPTGAAVPGASITISSSETGFSKSIATDSAGYYVVGPMNPGSYTILITSPGFQKTQIHTVVQTGTVTSGNYKLVVGAQEQTVDVTAGTLQVNTEQSGVSDVITRQQIESLPVNGRNFLDLAQVEPGVILQSGETFDPTKAGYSAISVGGVSGRTTRILLDGQDITDETVGTTIFNVSQGAISEFQLNRSTQDVSGDVTSSGLLLVSTGSGTNKLHGQLFYDFQDGRALFATQRGILPVFQRNQFGGSVGGPIIKDKLFFFGNSERIKQDSSQATSVVTTANGGLFGSIAAAHPTIPSPFRDTYSTVRLDYHGPFGGNYFIRANYEVNSVASNFGDGYWLYANRDNTPGLAGGVDLQTGKFTHSIRGSYEKFHNLISDSTSGNAGIYNGIPGFAFYNVAQGLYSGPNYLAPQGTFQSDKQVRYDGSWTHGAHQIRYGYSVNRILGGGFAAFFGLSPRASESSSSLLNGVVSSKNPLGLGCNGVVGGAACPNDPINGYHVRGVLIGNGQGYFTENPGFGLPGGGVADWRQGAYISDSWKALPSLTLNVGVRWSVDTGRANQDAPAPLCSDVDTASVGTPCTGSTSLLAQFRSDLGGQVHQPYGNFGPQAGFVFSPGNHKMSIRGGFGIYYENDVFNNTTNARNGLLKQGAFFDYKPLCISYGVYSIKFPDGTVRTTIDGTPTGVPISTACSQSLAVAGPEFIQLQKAYQANTKAHSALGNGSYVGETLQGGSMYGAPYRTPYSEQWNAGIQRQVWKGAIISADYIHNTTLKISQTIDVNHVGAARFLNTPAAQAAIAATNNSFGCGNLSTQAASQCAINKGARITDYAGNGLDSGNAYLASYPAAAYGLTPAQGAAFPGQNPALGNGSFLLPIGRSAYDALQVVYKQQATRPAPGIASANIQVSYSLSRIITSSGGGSDQFFSAGSFDNDNPNQFMGRAGLDRTHEVSFGGSILMKGPAILYHAGPRLSFIGHFYSAPPATLSLDAGNATGAIFQSDVTGDGTTGDIAPGTNPGDYGHAVKASALQGFITNFNTTQANTLTPAGKALVTAGLFSTQQLIAMQAAVQPIANLPGPALALPMFKTMDVSFSYPIPLSFIREGMSIEPGIAFFNAFNFANYGPVVSGVLENTTSAGGTTNTQQGFLTGDTSTALTSARFQRGSGTFDQGAPRSTEFQLKLNF